jgi:signal transduction histidine kinase
VVVIVSDNGIGIDPVYLPRVFEMYFRANERSTGNGLGLYIVKKMVDKMNGRIEIKSELGKGTEVKIFIPFTLR